MKALGKLLPVDGFKTTLYQSLTKDYLASLIHLYQPLIGIEATVLYQLLLQEHLVQDDDEIQTHHTLMNYLNLPLNVIFRARLKLEGIGLLKTYQIKNEEQNVYLYELYSPYDSKRFFEEVLLVELLFHHVGERKFKRLKEIYANEKEMTEGKDITAKFNDIFSTIVPVDDQVNPNILLDQREEPFAVQFDFEEFRLTLEQQMIPSEKVLTSKNKRVLAQLKELYDLESYEIEKAMLWSLTEENELDIQLLQSICLDIFKGKDNHVKVQLTDQQPDIKKEKKSTEHFGKYDALKEHLDYITPRELLEDLSRGQTASSQDLKNISDIMAKQNLPQGVMNVAIYYCLLQSDMQLSKSYLETIASHWSRLNLQTVSEAMDYALGKLKPKQKTSYRRYNNQKKEVIPDWFKKQKSNESKPKDHTHQKEENPKEREEILKMMQKFIKEE